MEKKLTLNEKLDLILANQEKILSNEKKILKEEFELIEGEKDILKQEENIKNLENTQIKFENEEISDERYIIEELNSLHKEFKKSINNPIKKITKRDIVKGFIGAFIGIVGHFAFSKAADISKEITLRHASFLYLVSLLIIIIMLYYTGFRNIEKKLLLKFMPIRALILYIVSIFTVIFVYFLFGKFHFPLDYNYMYKMIGSTLVLAVLGAGTADLIGRTE